MEIDSARHNRRSIRLRGYDYSQDGMYFLTICANQQECLFGKIVNGSMRLNELGRIVSEQWVAVSERFPTVELDAFVVMPNHFHGILAIADKSTDVRAPLAGAQYSGDEPSHHVVSRATRRVAPTNDSPTLGEIVGAYKSLCVHHCLEWIKRNAPGRVLGKLWQRNYWEHIIRNESELNQIREYIHNNPAQWELDKLFVENRV